MYFLSTSVLQILIFIPFLGTGCKIFWTQLYIFHWWCFSNVCTTFYTFTSIAGGKCLILISCLVFLLIIMISISSVLLLFIFLAIFFSTCGHSLCHSDICLFGSLQHLLMYFLKGLWVSIANQTACKISDKSSMFVFLA